MQCKLTAIAAIGPKNELGGAGKLLYRSSVDMGFFSGYTQGKTVIMGRTTFEECGILPGRRNVVLSSTLPEDERYIVARSIEEALHGQSEAVVIGGADVYRQLAPCVSELYLSVWNVPPEKPADVFFPRDSYAHLDSSALVMRPRGERFTIVKYFKQ